MNKQYASMKTRFLLFLLLGLTIAVGCRQSSPKPSSPSAEPADSKPADSVFVPKQEPQSIPYIFGGDLSNYYHVRRCTMTRLSRLELESLGITPADDHHYYLVALGLMRNGVPFDFPIEGIECMYDLWLVPTSFPDGRFNVNAQVLNSNNIRVGELTFSRADNLKDLLRKCPNQGDFMVIEDLLDIERFFDHPSNKLDIRGYIKPVKEVPAKKRRNRKS